MSKFLVLLYFIGIVLLVFSGILFHRYISGTSNYQILEFVFAVASLGVGISATVASLNHILNKLE